MSDTNYHNNSNNNNHPIPPSPSAPMYQEDYATTASIGSPSHGAFSPPSSHHNPQPPPHHHQQSSDKVIGAAAIAGGVAGLALAGPVIGIVSAVGAGALATQNNKAGDVARASGDVVLAAGQRAKKLDQKHHVVDKTKKAAGGLFQKAKQFENKHHLGEKTGKGLTKGLQFVASKIKPKDGGTR
mmetsp:Transcript_5093/g.9667  ORF Transcript_5093/g.9667 Transcript_5093/m.9667 type:complete len:184 (+) Transcript_5093:73-624(+)